MHAVFDYFKQMMAKWDRVRSIIAAVYEKVAVASKFKQAVS